MMEQLFNRLTSIDQNIGTLKDDVSLLKSDVSSLKSDVSILKSDVAIMKTDIIRINSRLDAVYEQTAELLEFKFEATEKLDHIIADNISLQGVIGEHEIALHSLRRRPLEAKSG